MLLLLPGAGLGALLFYVSGAIAYDPNGCGGCIAWGWPWFWEIRATGPGPFGGPPMEPQFTLDAVFWVAIGIILVQVFAPTVFPRMSSYLRPEGSQIPEASAPKNA